MALPIIFPPAVTSQQEADAIYFTSVFPPDCTSLSPHEISHSLQKFSESMSGTKLNALMTRYRKEGVPPDSYQFTLRDLCGGKGTHTMESSGYGKFFMDSERGLALGIKNLVDENTVWIGVAGIAIGKELDFYNRDVPEESIKGRMNFTYQFPIITQLQGPGTRNYWDGEISRKKTKAIYQEAAKALGKYKWERALIDIVLEWAVLQGIPAVYLLPGNMQRWYPDKHKEAYDMRYDISGQRMGFRMQPNGLYGISLLGAVSTI